MSTKDEKYWLQAILEGKVKPGDAEWERIWKERDFTAVRRVLREIGMWKKDELVADREKMWQVIEQYRGEGMNRRRIPVTFVIGWNFMDESAREKGDACCGSCTGD